MAYIILPSRFTTQPSGPTAAAKSGIANGLVVLVTGGLQHGNTLTSVRNCTGLGQGTITGSPTAPYVTVSGGYKGLQFHPGGGANGIASATFPNALVPDASDLTTFWHGYIDNLDGTNSNLWGRGDGNDSWRTLFLNSTSARVSYIDSSPAQYNVDLTGLSLSTGDEFVFVSRKRGTTTSIFLRHKRGALLSNSATAGNGIFRASGSFGLALGTSVGTGASHERLILGAAWRRALSDSEISALAFDNAWGELFFNSPRRIYVPSAGTGGGTQALTPELFTGAQTFYAPSVSAGAVSLTPGLYTSSQTFYAPAVTTGAVSLAPALFSNSQTFYGATVAAGAFTLQPQLVSNAQTFHAPSVGVVAVTLLPGLLSNGQTLYAPVVEQAGAGANLYPTLLGNAQSFYAASITTGGVMVQPTLHTNSTTFYGPAVAARYTLAAPLLVNAQSFFAPEITQSAGQIIVPLVVNSSAFFAHVLAGGSEIIVPVYASSAGSTQRSRGARAKQATTRARAAQASARRRAN